MTADAIDEPSHRRVAGGHCFLEGVWDGSLPEHSFDRWLAQDYLFAQALALEPGTYGLPTLRSWQSLLLPVSHCATTGLTVPNPR